ncbi:MAG: hypothetical protein FJ011_09560 [Chloroflexi bacterium]|nr:hypothetical protein [Chloroflexota bacterium]
MRHSMPRFFGHWPIIIAVAFGAILLALGLSAAPAPAGLAAPQAPADACPIVPNTPNYTLAAGAVRLDGAEAAVGTIVSALSPRGDVVGCTEVSEAGHYGAMYVYGEDISASPPIPGMRDGETVSFRVNGLSATASPALVWRNDWATHPITLTAWTPTPTPTPTFTPTPTHTPTVANRPDLIVKSIQVAPAAPVVGQALAVTVTLKNQGTAAASGLFYTDVYADYTPTGCNDLGWDYRESNGLAAGAEAVLSFTHPGFGATGTHFIRGYVDSSCQITEADEVNNIGLLRVTVNAAPAPPVAPAVAIAREAGNSAALTWAHAAANASYQVWRGTAPYFSPGAGATLIGDGATGNCSNVGGAVACTDPVALGDPAANVFYLVRAFNAAGAAADSNRVGGFAFALQPGNP